MSKPGSILFTVAVLFGVALAAAGEDIKICVFSRPRAEIVVNGVPAGKQTDAWVSAPAGDGISIELRTKGYISTNRILSLAKADDLVKHVDFGELVPAGLSDEARKQLAVLKYIANDLSEITAPEQRQDLFKEYFTESDKFLTMGEPPIDVWTIRAAACLALNKPKEGWEAGQKLVALGPESANDTNSVLVVAALKDRGWLGSAPLELSKPSLDKEWGNSLGMKFKPVAGTKVLFSVWQTRIRDYRTYADLTSGVDTHWKRASYRDTPVSPDDNCPVVELCWDDAKGFCDWLTKKEREEGRLSANEMYRLPTDVEWSAAVGLEDEFGDTPEERSMSGRSHRGGKYPWGTQWPPPEGSGNLADQSLKNKFTESTVIDRYDDGFVVTAPVGSYKPNALGLYDVGTNVREWCEDPYTASSDGREKRTVRGASWLYFDKKPTELLASNRDQLSRLAHSETVGFRCVLVLGGGK